MSFFAGKKLLFIGFLAVLLAVVPLTVFFLQTRTSTKSKAEAATIMCFAQPSTTNCLDDTTAVQAKVGEKLALDIILDPTGGTGVEKNKIIVATISINYDAGKLEADPAKDTSPDKNTAKLGFAFPDTDPASPGFTQNLVASTYTTGNASVTRSVGTDALKAITKKTTIATITFKALAVGSEIRISFDQTKSNATSTIDPEVNVLSSVLPALIKIVEASTSTPTNPPAATTTPPPTPTGAAGTGTPNQIPVCTGLNVDRTTSGPAPFSITFTANGNDTDGTISSVTFDFGDGPVQTETSGGGIGSKTVSVAKAHTYNNPGTYTAKVTLTDSSGGLSTASASCTQNITVIKGTGEETATTTPIAQTSIQTPTPIPQKTFTEQPGPGNTILGIGAAGAALIIIGTILFFAL
ncbi:MAG: PKD domain-containing protein [Candidatus Levybacteria bacterium]|nr:PKD domain-containing protein [Candidatus Levybacteria bacterium]